MAVRDQNLQILRAWVVVATMFAVLLGIGLIWVAVTLSTRTQQMEEAQTRAAERDTAYRQLDNQLQIVRKMIGVDKISGAEFQQLTSTTSGDEKVKEMQDRYVRDMTTFGAAVPEQDRSYTNLVAYLMQELRNRNQQIETGAKRIERLETDNATVLESVKAEATRERERADMLEAQLANERADFTAKITAGQQLLEAASAEMDKLKKSAAAKENQLNTLLTQARDEIDRLRRNNSQLAELRTRLEREDFLAPQGEISQVYASGRQVYVDLGSQDGLRAGVRFMVMNPDSMNIDDAEPKARIEIVEVNDKVSRARVLEDSNFDPIVTGDLVYSPSWEPGRTVEFGLVGKLDVNNDGIDDRNLVKDLIRRAGGEIVAELDPNGQLTGQIDINTKFLVLGEDFSAEASRDSSNPRQAFMSKYEQLLRQADGAGVRQINLDKLMNWLRGSVNEMSVPAGSAARASDNEFVRPDQPSSLAPVTEIFSRQPQE